MKKLTFSIALSALILSASVASSSAHTLPISNSSNKFFQPKIAKFRGSMEFPLQGILV